MAKEITIFVVATIFEIYKSSIRFTNKETTMKKYLILSLLIFSTQVHAGFGLKCQSVHSYLKTTTVAYVIEDGNLAYMKLASDSKGSGPLKEWSFNKLIKTSTSDFEYTYEIVDEFLTQTLTVSRNGDFISNYSARSSYDENCKVLKGAEYNKLLKRAKNAEAKKNNNYQNKLNKRKL